MGSVGVYSWQSHGNWIDQNRINGGISGIYAQESLNFNVIGNTLVNNSRGISLLTWSGNFSIFDNILMNNSEGLHMDSYTRKSTIFHNYLGNTENAIPSGSVHNWNLTYSPNLTDCSKNGNYWSDYTGHDMYKGPNQDQPGSDGIGDTPYKIDSQNWDYLPLMQWDNRTATKTDFYFDPEIAHWGQIVELLGNLTTVDNEPIQNAVVTVKAFGFAADLTTNSTGWFNASSPVWTVGKFKVTVEYAGSGQYFPSSDWEILVVKAGTSIYAKFNPNPVYPGNTCELRGILVDQFSKPIKSAILSLEYSTDYGSNWQPGGTLVTDPYGIFSKTFTVPPPPQRTYLVRISYAGSLDHEPSATVIALIVR